MPWLRCPHFRCNIPIAPADLRALDPLLTVTLLRCQLARNEHFRVCPTSKCPYGFMIMQVS
jgi:hypothetical protein